MSHAVEGNTLEVLGYDPIMDAFEGSGDEVDPAQALVIMALFTLILYSLSYWLLVRGTGLRQ